MPAHLAESPLTCVAVGSGRSLEEFEVIHRTNKNSRNRRRRPLGAAGCRPDPLRETSSTVYDKTVRRRRAVLALLVACSLLLLTAYFGESAGGALHGVQRGVLEVVSPVQEGASRALKPVRDLVGWVGDTLRRQGRARRPAQAARRAARRQASPAPPPCARTPQLSSLRLDQDGWASTRPPAGHRARHRAARRRSGTRRSTSTRAPATACGSTSRSITGDGPRRHGDLRDRLDRGRHADHRPHERRLGRSSTSSGRDGRRRDRGRAPRRPAHELHPPPGPRRPRADRGHRRHALRRTAAARCYPPGIPIGPRDEVDDPEHDVYQRVHIRPFADLRRLDFVQVLTKPEGSRAGDRRRRPASSSCA